MTVTFAQQKSSCRPETPSPTNAACSLLVSLIAFLASTLPQLQIKAPPQARITKQTQPTRFPFKKPSFTPPPPPKPTNKPTKATQPKPPPAPTKCDRMRQNATSTQNAISQP